MTTLSPVCRRIGLILAAAALTMTLDACGKAGSPRPVGYSPYPRFYPNPNAAPSGGESAPTSNDATPVPAAGDTSPRFTQKGSYIDPSVDATNFLAVNRVVPGSNLPYTRQQSSEDPLSSGMETTLSPSHLPPLPAMLPDLEPEPEKAPAPTSETGRP